MKLKSILLSLLAIGALVVIAVYLIMGSQQETATLDDEARSHAPGKFIRLSDGLVHYSLTGPDSARLLVFIHGGGITGMEVWKNTTPYFSNYRILQYDLYGRGYSDRTDKTYEPGLLLHQLEELTDSLGIHENFDIVTMSLGAIIAIDYAARHSSAVGKIVLLDPTATGDFKPSVLLKIPVVAQLVITCYWHPRAIEKQRREFVNQDLFEEYTHRLAYFMNFKGYKKLAHDTWLYILTQNRLDEVKELPPNRILIIYGDHDPFFPNIPQYNAVYPSVQSVEIKEAGHMPHYEQPEVVNPVIEGFLSSPPTPLHTGEGSGTPI